MPHIVHRLEHMNKQIDSLLSDLTDPEMYGFAVPDEVRERVKAVREEIATNEAVVKAISAILIEREYQDKKHGPISTNGHTLGEWLIIAEAELDEAKVSLIKGGQWRDSLRSEIIQTAAVLVACLEQHGTIDEHNGRQI